MGARRVALALSLAFAAACAEDPLPGLEAEKRTLLETTLPRAEFWVEVERKGELLKRQRAIEEEIAELESRLAALETEITQAATSLAGAEQVNAKAESLLAQNRTELARVERERSEREALLAAFRARETSTAAALAPPAGQRTAGPRSP